MPKPLEVLFVLPHPPIGAASRYRAYQYFPYLEAAGVRCTPAPLLPPSLYAPATVKGRCPGKTAAGALAALRRLSDVVRAGRYDTVYLLREAFPIGPPTFERLILWRNPRLVYDMDDAIYIRDPLVQNPLHGLRDYGKPRKVMARAREVIVANSRLAAYAREYSPSVTVIPTAIDMRRYDARPEAQGDPIVLGWIGSPWNVRHLEAIADVLRTLAQKHSFVLRIVGGEPIPLQGVSVEAKPWSLEDEISDLHTFDIGLMPIPNQPFALGKAGCKALQYMGVGIPVMASREGPGEELIEDGVEGFLAGSDAEWAEKLERLIRDASLRQRMGLAGREKVAERFSVQANWQHLLAVLRRAAEAET